MTYAFLHTLLETTEKYEQEGGTPDMQHFARWVLKNPDSTGGTAPGERPFQADYAAMPAALHLNLLIYRLQRLWEIQTKSLFQEHADLANLNELRIMACVANKQQPKKNEVISEVLLESTTGTMLIQRLVSRGFLTETPDPSDRRAIRLEVTGPGNAALQSLLSALWGELHPFLAPLDEKELHQAVDLLRRLDR
jgi:DNA-binding MarR family transcriptional regulator